MCELDQWDGAAGYQRVKTWNGHGDGAQIVRFAMLTSTCKDRLATRANVDAFLGYSRQKRYSDDPDSRLKEVVEGARTTSFEYDKNGSATKTTAGSQVTNYSWDGAKRLKEVKLNGTTQASFTYDGNGARTSKTAGGATGLINLRARYYAPQLGRFISRDVLSGKDTAPVFPRGLDSGKKPAGLCRAAPCWTILTARYGQVPVGAGW